MSSPSVVAVHGVNGLTANRTSVKHGFHFTIQKMNVSLLLIPSEAFLYGLKPKIG